MEAPKTLSEAFEIAERQGVTTLGGLLAIMTGDPEYAIPITTETEQEEAD